MDCALALIYRECFPLVTVLLDKCPNNLHRWTRPSLDYTIVTISNAIISWECLWFQIRRERNEPFFWLITVSQSNTVLKCGAINCKLIVMWYVAEAHWPDNWESGDLIGQFYRTDSNILEKWTELGKMKISTS